MLVMVVCVKRDNEMQQRAMTERMKASNEGYFVMRLIVTNGYRETNQVHKTSKLGNL